MEFIAIVFGSLVLLMAALIAFAGGYLLWSFFTMRLFQKAGVQGAWRAWVPFYSQMIFLKLGDVNPLLFLFVLIGWIDVIGPIANLFVWVMMCLAAYRIGLKLQKEDWWVVLFAVPPITFIWLGVMALDGSRWNPQVPPAAWAANGFLADRSTWDGIPAQAVAAPQGAPAWGQPGYPAASGYAGHMYGGPNQPPAAADPFVPPRPPAPGTAHPPAAPTDPARRPAPPAASDPLAPPQPPSTPPTTPPPFDPPTPPTTPQNPPA